MDSELEVEKRRRDLNSIISEINSVINHAEDSYQQLRRLNKIHKDSLCYKDCFDSFPHPQIVLNAKLELDYLVQEFTARSATETLPARRWQALLSRAYCKLDEAHELFEKLHKTCFEYTKRPKTRKCKARPSIVKEFQM